MAMTVDELIEHLQSLKVEGHGEKSVMFTYQYGDYWRTTVAQGVDEGHVGLVKHSDYHQMYKVVDADDEDDGEEPKAPDGSSEVILLS